MFIDYVTVFIVLLNVEDGFLSTRQKQAGTRLNSTSIYFIRLKQARTNLKTSSHTVSNLKTKKDEQGKRQDPNK